MRVYLESPLPFAIGWEISWPARQAAGHGNNFHTVFKQSFNPTGNLPISALLNSMLLEPIHQDKEQICASSPQRKKVNSHSLNRWPMPGHSLHINGLIFLNSPNTRNVHEVSVSRGCSAHWKQGQKQLIRQENLLLQWYPFLFGLSCFPSRCAAIPAGLLANTSTIIIANRAGLRHR